MQAVHLVTVLYKAVYSIESCSQQGKKQFCADYCTASCTALRCSALASYTAGNLTGVQPAVLLQSKVLPEYIQTARWSAVRLPSVQLATI
jgi:hypothetical protein